VLDELPLREYLHTSLPLLSKILIAGHRNCHPIPFGIDSLAVRRNGPALYCRRHGLRPAQIQSAINRTCHHMSVFIGNDVRHDEIEGVTFISGFSSLNQAPQFVR
jgi:hypothetical protein